jgi:hypothetical protein
MHYRRIACFMLGLWLGGGLLMAWVAAQNSRSVDRLLSQSNPFVAVQIKTLGPAGTRLLLRYQAAEQDRWYFESWELAEIIWGAGLLLYLLFGSTEGKVSLLLVLLMVVLAVLQRLLLTPEMASLGRLASLIPPGEPSSERTRFWMLHNAYFGVELLKWGLGLLLAGRLVWRRRGRSGDSGQEINLVDKANYRHVDR